MAEVKRAALLALALAAGCGGASSAPVDVPLGELTVRLEPSPARLVILGPDGNPLLTGLAGGKVKAGDPPYVAAAFGSAQASWQELYGSFLVDEPDPNWQGVERFSDIRVANDRSGVTFTLDGPQGGGTGSIQKIADGTLAISLSVPNTNRASAAFTCAGSEHFIGFGAQTADVDQRGQTVPIWVSEQGIGKVADDDPPADWFFRGTRHQSYFPVPFFVSSGGYGVQADTTRHTIFAMCSEKSDAWRLESWEGTLAFHLFYGAKPADVIRAHSDFQGRPPVPPDFAFAPWNDAIEGSANIRQVASVLRQNHIPSSVIWTEDWAGGIHAGDNYNLTYEWSVDRTLYPDVEQLASELHGQGFKWLAYFNTFLESTAAHYPTAIANHYEIEQADGTPYLFDSARFVKASLLDLTNPAAADFLAGFMNRAIDLGFDGWMADYGEWLPVDAKLASGEDAESVHQQYPISWQKLNERVLGARTDGVDRLVFVRSGYSGSQPIAHQVVWGGDQSTEFSADDGLPTVIPIAIGLGVAGLPYFGSDIAGYQTAPGHPDSTKELFFRWTELGALSPIMRTHHGVAPALEWSFQRDAETLAHYGHWARVHMQLFPYLKAAAAQAASDGMPMVRELARGYPDDPQAWSLTDEYLLGPSLLVAPVVTMGATARTVHFPKGRWFPLFQVTPTAAIDGPGEVSVNATMSELPVFAPAGTVLVLLPDGTDTVAPSSEPGVHDLSFAGDSREVVALGGGSGDFVETNGLSYHLVWSHLPNASAQAAWNGTPLGACGPTPVAPCAQIQPGQNEVIADVTGPGTLSFGDSTGAAVTLEVPGGRADRALTLHLRW